MHDTELHFPANKHITVHLIDGTDHKMVVSMIVVDGPIIRFGRDDGSGWREFLSAPLSSVSYWD